MRTEPGRSASRPAPCAVAATFVAVALVSCSGGGSGGSGTGKKTVQAPQSLPAVAPSLFVSIEGPELVEAGASWTGRIETLATDPAPLDHFLLVHPPGMTVDTQTGELEWTVGEGTSGVFEILGGARFTGEAGAVVGVTATLWIGVQGIAPEVEAVVGASGGELAVTDSSSPIFGARAVFPPNVLLGVVPVTIGRLTDKLNLAERIEGVAFGPSIDFPDPVTLELPYTEGYLAAMGIEDEARLRVWTFDEDRGRWTLLPGSVPDTVNNRVSVDVDHFSWFAVFPDDLAAFSAPVQTQLSGLIEPLVGAEVLLQGDSVAEALINLRATLYQPRAVEFFPPGEHFRREGRNALLIHGLAAEPGSYAGECGLIEHLLSRYDTVATLRYPSGLEAEDTADWLARQLLLDEANFERGALFDVYGHGTGGLIGRWLIEQRSEVLLEARLGVPNLVTLGTPHLGGDPSQLFQGAHALWEDASGLLGSGLAPGLDELAWDSEFLERLNPAAFQGWTLYYTLAGDVGTGVDGWVDVTSALPFGLFDVALPLLFSGQDHVQIHSSICANGVAPTLDALVQPKSFYPEGVIFAGSLLELGNTSPQGCTSKVETTTWLRFADDFALPPNTVVWAGKEQVCFDEELEPTSEKSWGHFLLFTDGNPSVTLDPELVELGEAYLYDQDAAGKTIAFPLGELDPVKKMCPCPGSEEPVPLLDTVAQFTYAEDGSMKVLCTENCDGI